MTPQDDWRALYDEAVRQCNQQVNTITELEAARDHLRARLRALCDTWKTGKHGGYDVAKGQCAADLLAVLTEPPPQQKP